MAPLALLHEHRPDMPLEVLEVVRGRRDGGIFGPARARADDHPHQGGNDRNVRNPLEPHLNILPSVGPAHPTGPARRGVPRLNVAAWP